jgi:hypothetical protein
MINFQSGLISGRAQKALEEVEEQARQHPDMPVFTSSKDYAEYLKSRVPGVIVKVCERPENKKESDIEA